MFWGSFVSHPDICLRKLLRAMSAGDRRTARAISLALLLWSAVASGCAGTNYVSLRHAPQNPLSGPLKLLSFQGPRATARTEQLLRRYDLSKSDVEQRLARLQDEIAAEPQPEKLYAFAELAYIGGKRAEALRNEALALDLYGASVAHAYWYLLDPQLDRFRNPYDPQFRGACDLYNGSLEAAMRIVSRNGQLLPGHTYTIRTRNQLFKVAIVSRGRWHPEDFEQLKFVSDYEINGLTNRHHTYGLGVPLIAVRRGHESEDSAEQFYPSGLSFAATAFLRVTRPPGGRDTDHPVHCVLELHDPLVGRDILVDDRIVPLETDLSTPLAYFLDSPDLKESHNIATWALLRPESASRLKGLYMLEPYDPRKIPVLMVHGLWSSPVTWMEMFNDLRSFPKLRDQYQFWFYLYPTGQPFWISASQLRDDLAGVRRTIDPRNEQPALDQMVLVGHSMGGLVSKLQTLESGQDYWQILSDRPFDELQGDGETRDRLARTVFFHPNPSIRRVITIATPHRGSDFANDYTRWLGRKLITLPELMVGLTQDVTRDNPDLFKDTGFLTINTSIDSLAPDAPIFPVMMKSRRAAWTRYHNIVGLVPEKGIVGSLAAGSDGVVAFDSAHLDDADSEITVAAGHISIHRHPKSILEVRRILLEHRVEAIAEMSRQPVMAPAGYRQ